MSTFFHKVKKILGIKSSNNINNTGIKPPTTIINPKTSTPKNLNITEIIPAISSQSQNKPKKVNLEKAGTLTLQDQINSVCDGDIFSFPYPHEEYPGNIIINHPVIIDGKNATLWSLKGTGISILSDGVTLRNLRIEVTGENHNHPQDNCAIFVQSGYKLQFDNIEVRGTIMGIPTEEGDWKYPQSLHLGKLVYGQEHNFIMKIIVPIPCKIAANISGIDFNPIQLNPGLNNIEIQIESMPKDTLIDGSIFLVSPSVKRRIALTAHVISATDENHQNPINNIIWQPEELNNIISVPEVTQTELVNISVEAKKSINIRRGEIPNSQIFASNNINLPSENINITNKSQISDIFNQPAQNTVKENENQERSPSINPLFTQTNSENQPTEKEEKIDNQSVEEPKRKIVKSNQISPLFGNINNPK